MNWSIKYRPQTFDEVAGLVKIVQELKKRIIDNNIPKVVMFSGFTGIGKTTISNIYIKALLCENLQEYNPCNICKNCQMVDNNSPSDILTTLNASSIGIDELRNLEEKANRKILGKQNKKIFMIDELQELPSVRTQKSILKILEKSNDNVYWILGTMQLSRIDSAIKNRSLVYNLNLTIPDIRNYLVSILKKENIEATPELAKMVVAITNNCNNSMRTAISFLERVVYSGITDENSLYQELGIVSEERLVDFINGIFKADINILQIKPDQSMLDQIKQKLILLFEFYNGMTLNEWQKGQLKGIEKVDSKILETIISILNELTVYPYLNQSMIEFQIVKCILKVKENVLMFQKGPEIKRGRG